VVTVADEFAGSDGDIVTAAIKLLGLGPVVGTRTWGGVVGIWPRHALVDGTQTTQPEFSFWFSDVGFGVENYGTDPTIEVDNAPQDARDGRDRQLEASLATALELVEKHKPGVPDFGELPVLARKPLPARKR
jgi:tricorn protease